MLAPAGWQLIKAGELHAREVPQPLRLEVRRDGRSLAPGAELANEPQVLCSPDGDMTPFEARLSLADGDVRWLVAFGADGNLGLNREERKP